MDGTTRVHLRECDVRMRRLRPSDRRRAVALHERCLPVRYDADFYRRATTGRLLTVACEREGEIVGIVVARVQSQAQRTSDSALVEPTVWGGELLYLMTVVVEPEHRRCGIATLLISRLVCDACKRFENLQAVFLHVLDTNWAALRFYEAGGFHRHETLRHYYRIQGMPRNALVLVKYLNSSGPPLPMPQGTCSLQGWALWTRRKAISVASFLTELEPS